MDGLLHLIYSLMWVTLGGFNGCLASDSVPKLDISVTHENKPELHPGESFWYAFNITHNAASNGEAKDVLVTWYIPDYLNFRQLSNGINDIMVNITGDVVHFKKSLIPLGSAVTVKFQVALSNSSEISQDHHYAVVSISSLWYSANSVRHNNPLSSYSLEFVVPGCSKALGMENGEIKSHQLLASSSLPASRPEMARFNQDAWCAQQQDSNQFIQVIFQKKARITKIVTMGRSMKPHWVKEFSIQFSDDNLNWISYKENGFEKIFKANSDLSSPVGHWLMYPIAANYIRIHPKSWNTQICMRFELYGCQISGTDNCINPIGMESGTIPDAALSHSVTDSSLPTSPLNARLNKKVNDYPFGWATSLDPTKKDWIQIDLGSVHKITSTAIQGSSNEPESLFYVKSYELQFSNNSLDWVTGRKSSTEKLFRGPQSGEAAKFPTPAFFPTPRYARYVRLIPEESYSMNVLRMEIYGCASEKVPKIETPTEFSRRSTLLDKNANTLYVCVYRESKDERSCRHTANGVTWKDLNSQVASIIGYDTVSATLYGLDHFMSYMFSRDSGKTWAFISTQEWQRRQTEASFVKSTKLDEILVGTLPSLNWTSVTGHSWGVSGKGIHMKAQGAQWSLVSSWKCCGF
ncbi:neuropilin-2-like [Rhopilema esculentum]|uniref:neuropilin-2-like n=1 Tax=Rhopilema esculentum TaxID=499914 RepID=UPI0031D019A4